MNWVAVGALGAAVSIVLGAFGAHALEARLEIEALAIWETAARYLMYASLGLLGMGVLARQSSVAVGLAAPMLALGGLIFCGTLVLLALGGPRWLGAITPIGGVLMIAAFLRLAWGAFRHLS